MATPNGVKASSRPHFHFAGHAASSPHKIQNGKAVNLGPAAGRALNLKFAGTDWRKLHGQGGRLERFVTPRSLKAAPD